MFVGESVRDGTGGGWRGGGVVRVTHSEAGRVWIRGQMRSSFVSLSGRAGIARCPEVHLTDDAFASEVLRSR